MEVNHNSVMSTIAKSTCQAPDFFYLAVQALGHSVRHSMMYVSHDVFKMGFDRLGCLLHRLQASMRSPEIPLLKNFRAQVSL
jgi:hypothetical protein